MRRTASLVVIALALTACRASTPTPSATDATGSPSASASASPTQTPRLKAPRAALAVYSTGTELVLYDVAGDEVRVVARGQGLSQPRFLTRNLVTFVREETGGAGTMFQLDLRKGETQELFRIDSGIDVYAFHPKGREVAYVTRGDDAFPRLRIITLVEGRPVQSVAVLARALGREITPDDELDIRWARKGARFFVVYTFADGSGEASDSQSQFQVRARDGSLEYAAAHAEEPTMATWSSDGRLIYFRTDAGVRSYRPSNGEVRAAASVRWYNPSPSQDGRLIAFDTGQGNPRARVRLLDLATGAIETIGERGRIHPVFAAPNLVWAQVLAPCEQEDCLYPAFPADRVVQINRKTGRERVLPITKLIGSDIWFERPA